MNNFIFENKTKVYFGERMCRRVSAENRCRCMGIRFCLSMAAARSRKNGVYEEVIAALEKPGKRSLNFRGSWKIRLIRRCLKAQSW